MSPMKARTEECTFFFTHIFLLYVALVSSMVGVYGFGMYCFRFIALACIALDVLL